MKEISFGSFPPRRAGEYGTQDILLGDDVVGTIERMIQWSKAGSSRSLTGKLLGYTVEWWLEDAKGKPIEPNQDFVTLGEAHAYARTVLAKRFHS